MADELIRRAARAIRDLRELATTLNNTGYPGDAIRIQGFAGTLRELEAKLTEAQAKVDFELFGATHTEDFEVEQTSEPKSTKHKRDLPTSGPQRVLVAQ